MTTVTVEIDDDLLARARVLAAARNMTVAQMLQRLLRVAAAAPPHPDELPPLTRQAMGILPPMTDEEARQTLDEQRGRKHGSP